jgi:molybdopterin synthase sulfur carrier subunit
MKQVKLRYFAILREEARKAEEWVETQAEDVAGLFAQLQQRYGFSLSAELVKVAINQEYRDFSSPIEAADEIVFIPPVAGG